MKNLSDTKKKILIFSEYYLPGFKSGGGMRTIVNIVTSLKDRYDFFIITNDHDGPSDKTPYGNVKLDDWNEIQGAKVYYLSKRKVGFAKILELVNEIKPDILYSNSYFSIFNVYLLVLNRLKKFENMSYLISPCGELSDGALKVSYYRKQIFLFLAKQLNFHRRIFWKVTNQTEKSEIERLKVVSQKIYIAPDLVAKNGSFERKELIKPKKINGAVKFIFLSRFSEKKNFKFFIENLENIKGDVIVDIYAPIDVESYWKECLKEIKKLPDNVKVEAKKPVPHPEVHETLMKYHFFVMPTLGENFGHVFLEALSAGCPLLISNRTPWQNLEQKKIGWDLPLEDRSVWKKTIKKCIEMGEPEFQGLSKNSVCFAKNWFKENELEKKTVKLFEEI